MLSVGPSSIRYGVCLLDTLCPNPTPLLCFQREMGLTIHLIGKSIRFSIIVNLVRVTFGSIYRIFLLRAHALKQCNRFNGLYNEKNLLKELLVKMIRGNESGKCSGHFCA